MGQQKKLAVFVLTHTVRRVVVVSSVDIYTNVQTLTQDEQTQLLENIWELYGFTKFSALLYELYLIYEQSLLKFFRLLIYQ